MHCENNLLWKKKNLTFVDRIETFTKCPMELRSCLQFWKSLGEKQAEITEKQSVSKIDETFVK